MSSTALAIVPKQSVSLYELEETLVAFVEAMEMVPPEDEPAFLEAFSQALMAAQDKRDKVAQFLAHLESQAEMAKAEIKRLQERKADFEAARDRLEAYVVKVIESLGTDAKGKLQKLEGKYSTLSLRACPVSVEVSDDTAVPDACQRVTVTLPAPMWTEVLDALDIETAGRVEEAAGQPKRTIDKAALKAALESNPDIPGARLVIGKHSLKRS